MCVAARVVDEQQRGKYAGCLDLNSSAVVDQLRNGQTGMSIAGCELIHRTVT